jgi:hypothetical protein
MNVHADEGAIWPVMRTEHRVHDFLDGRPVIPAHREVLKNFEGRRLENDGDSRKTDRTSFWVHEYVIGAAPRPAPAEQCPNSRREFRLVERERQAVVCARIQNLGRRWVRAIIHYENG